MIRQVDLMHHGGDFNQVDNVKVSNNIKSGLVLEFRKTIQKLF